MKVLAGTWISKSLGAKVLRFTFIATPGKSAWWRAQNTTPAGRRPASGVSIIIVCF
jgi:hypothetical protein